MTTDDRRALGAEGELRAAEYLARRGWRILERNARVEGVEIDMVARRGGLVAFVEVKTRRVRRFGGPELAVDRRKRARLARGAAGWLRARDARARRVRFDVVAVEVDGERRWRIRHWENAFQAGD